MTTHSNDIVIYSAKVCPFAQRTLILLNIKNVNYELIEIELDKKPSWFTKLSPYGKVPILKHNDKILYESAIINEYLEEQFPMPATLSKDAYQRAMMRIWIAYCNSELIPVYYKLLLGQDPSQYDELRDKLIQCLLFIENKGFGKHAENGPYFFGNNISLVDISYYPFFERFVTNEYYRDVKIPNECTKLRQWIKIMRKLPAVIPTQNAPDFYIQRYAKYADGSTPRTGAKKILDDLWS